jgi:hypothetical protein
MPIFKVKGDLGMKRLFYILMLGGLELAGTPVSGGTADAELTTTVEFQIEKRKDNTYSLTSHNAVEIAYLTGRGAYEDNVILHESFRTHISDVSASLNGRNIKGDHIIDAPSTDEYTFLADDRLYVIDFPSQPRIGEHLKYKYQQKYDDIALLPVIRIPDRCYVKSYEVRFKHPPEIQIDFEYFFPRGEIRHRVINTGPKETTLIFDSLDQSTDLPYFPFNDLKAAVLVSIKADMKEISPTTPERLYRWYTDQLVPCKSLDSQHISQLPDFGDTLVEPRTRLKFIYDFVRLSIRYIADLRGSHSIYPHDPGDILDNRYGDCKDHASLLSTIGRIAKLPVATCLVSTVPVPEFDGIHPWLYNHMICAYRDGAGTLFLDPTARYLPFEELPDHLIGQKALIMDSGGARIEEIASRDTLPQIDIDLRGQIDSLAIAKARIVLRAEALAWARTALESLSGNRLQKALDSIISTSFHNLIFTNYALENQQGDTLVLVAGVDLSRFIISSAGRRYLPQVPFAGIDADITEREHDTLPIYFDRPIDVALHMGLRMPHFAVHADSVAFAALPAALFHASIHADSSEQVELNYRFTRRLKRIAGDVRKPFMTFCGKFLAGNRTMFLTEGK